MIRILHLEPENYAHEAQEVLNRLGSVDFGPMSREQLLQSIENYDVVIVRLGHMIDEAVMEKSSRLRVIVTATTGLNHIDLVVAVKKNIAVLSLKGEQTFLNTIHATAEHTFGLILSLIRHIPFAHFDVISGRWDRDSFRGSELEGKTLGIVGLGRLGRKVSGYAKAFGMNIIAYDTDPAVNMPGVLMASLDELASKSDIVSIHIPSSPSNHYFIDKKFFCQMKKSSYLINTSRGDVLDQSALIQFLSNGVIAGAALDVLEEENNGVDPTLSACIKYAETHKNLILTPHIGGATKESMEKTEIFMAHKLKDWLQKSQL